MVIAALVDEWAQRERRITAVHHYAHAFDGLRRAA